jgi:hypothetical protein
MRMQRGQGMEITAVSQFPFSSRPNLVDAHHLETRLWNSLQRIQDYRAESNLARICRISRPPNNGF